MNYTQALAWRAAVIRPVNCAPKKSFASAWRRFFDLSGCEIFTVRQQVKRAGLAAALGAAGAVLATDWYEGRNPSPVTLLAPIIERAEVDYSVFRIPLEYRGSEVYCHIVLWHERGSWTVRC